MENLKNLWSQFCSATGKKVQITIITAIIETLRLAFPGWPLPSTQLVTTLYLSLISAHTISDVAFMVFTAVQDWLASRRLLGQNSMNNNTIKSV